MKRSKEQSKRLFAILAKLNMTEQRDVLAYQYSNQRTTSTRELTEEECEQLIDDLSEEVWKKEERTTKLRMRFFSVCHKLKWHRADAYLDYERINNWLLKYGYLKKRLNEYTEEELPKLLKQINNVLRSKAKEQ